MKVMHLHYLYDGIDVAVLMGVIDAALLPRLMEVRFSTLTGPQTGQIKGF
jgi:hypothetical protein